MPAGKPTCRIPTSVTTDKAATLTCYDGTGSPPPTYRWFRNGTPLPVDPKKIAAFQNSSYTLNPATGELVSYTSLLCTFSLSQLCLLKKKISKRKPSVLLFDSLCRNLQERPRWKPVNTTVRLSTKLARLRNAEP